MRLGGYLAKYNHLAALTRRGWAYEHLRRNTKFRKAAYARQSGVLKIDHWEDDIYTLDLLGPQPEAEAWGLIFFPNPDQSALTADLFWSETTFPNHISVNVIPRSPGEIDEIYEESRKICRVRQLTDWNGMEHVLVQGQGCALQIKCTGLSLRSTNPVKMSFQLSGPSSMEADFKLLKASRKTYIPHDLDNPHWTPRAERLRDGIIILDVLDAGLNLQHAARIIYGDKRVDEEWFDGQRAMKDRLRQRLENAKNLRDGGYRDFLAERI